ncbi:uncharacterized protein ACHE_30859A [Aspergillus chevalieri]|uniref:Uncharacterized protein n=1 Tax=Aspergillus chevalieri TaxID=182096 RepID=A0A7R7VLW0_ASPCH|nr:uncharacterized protein ACHE_30859A [Aspergillus chevalieri]BCR86872.1 hypothetical protein ACHE_30859A [Aspergillus chevalieri]
MVSCLPSPQPQLHFTSSPSLSLPFFFSSLFFLYAVSLSSIFLLFLSFSPFHPLFPLSPLLPVLALDFFVSSLGLFPLVTPSFFSSSLIALSFVVDFLSPSAGLKPCVCPLSSIP